MSETLTLIERLRRPMVIPPVLLCREAADELERLSRLSSREAVVEECAKVCDARAKMHGEIGARGDQIEEARECADAIRSLSPPSGMPKDDG